MSTSREIQDLDSTQLASELFDSHGLTRFLSRLSNGDTQRHILFFLLFYAPLPIIVIASSYFEGTLWLESVNGGKGLFEHFGSLSNMLLMPVIYFLYIHYVYLIAKMLKDILYRSNIAGKNSKSQNDSLIQSKVMPILLCKNIEHRVIKYLFVLLGIYSLVINSGQTTDSLHFYGNDVWDSYTYIFGYVAGRLLLFVQWVIILPFVAYTLFACCYAVTLIAQKISNNSFLVISPFAPDGCGGVGSLGQVMLASTYFLTPIYLIVVAHYFTHENIYLTLILASVFLVLLSIGMLLFPFLRLHGHLSEWKESSLSRLEHKLCDYLDIQAEEGLSGEVHVKALALEKVYSHVQTLRTWPYSLGDQLKWASTVLGIIVAWTPKILAYVMNGRAG